MLLEELFIKKESHTNIVNINNIEVEVLSYLPVEDKESLIRMAVEESFDYKGRMVRTIADAYFNLYVAYNYSNIEFTGKERKNALETYDCLEQNGIMDAIIAAIPEVEFNSLVEYYENYITAIDTYRNSIAGALDRIIGDLPSLMNGMDDTLNSFDLSKLETINSIISDLGGSSLATQEVLLGQK